MFDQHQRYLAVLLEKYKGQCAYCSRPVTFGPNRISTHWAIDHVVPRRQGGTDDIENLALSCFGCNSAKGRHSKEKFLAYRNGEIKTMGRDISRLTIVITREQGEELDRIVITEGRSRSWIIRQALDLYFKKAGIKTKGQ